MTPAAAQLLAEEAAAGAGAALVKTLGCRGRAGRRRLRRARAESGGPPVCAHPRGRRGGLIVAWPSH